MSNTHLGTIKSDSDESSVLSSETEDDLPYDTIDINSPVNQNNKADDENDSSAENQQSEMHNPNLKRRNQNTSMIRQSDFYENSDDSEIDYDELTNTKIAYKDTSSSDYNHMVSSIRSALENEDLNDKDSQVFNYLNQYRENDLSRREFLAFLQNKENFDINQLLESIDTHREILNSGKNPSSIRNSLNDSIQQLYITLQNLSIYYKNDFKLMNRVQNKFKQWEKEKSKCLEKSRQIERNTEFTEKLKTLNIEMHLLNTEIADIEVKLQKLKERKSIIKQELEFTKNSVDIKKSESEASYNAIESVENKAIDRLIEEEIVTLDLKNSLSQTNVVDNIKNAFKRMAFDSFIIDKRQINSRNLNLVLQQINAHCKNSRDLRQHYKSESESFNTKMHSCKKLFELLSSNEQKIMTLIKDSGELSANAGEIEQVFEASIQKINRVLLPVQDSESPNNPIFNRIYKNELTSLLSSLKLINPSNKIFLNITIEPTDLQFEYFQSNNSSSSLKITENAIYHKANGTFKSRERVLKINDAGEMKTSENKSYGSRLTEINGDKIKNE